MGAVTVNISFQPELLREIDAEAAREVRNRSDLLREAARLYIERQRRWDSVFQMGDRIAEHSDLTPADIEAEIAAARRERRGQS